MSIRGVGDYVQSNILHTDHAARHEERRIFQKIAQDTIGDTFLEDDPSVAEWFQDLVPTGSDIAVYFHNLFPSAVWIRRYNLHWLLGDAIAGK